MTRRLAICGWWMALLSLAMLGRCGCAQEKPDSPEPKTTQTAQSPSKTGTKDKDQEANDEVPKRIFWIIPNFMTANDQPQNLGPLTPKQKFNIAWHQWWDVSAHIGNLLQASISQAANGIPEYGQGWGAFGERYAAQEGDQFTGAMLIYGVLPTVHFSVVLSPGESQCRRVVFRVGHQSALQYGMESAEGIHAGPRCVFESAAPEKAPASGCERQPFPNFAGQLAVRNSIARAEHANRPWHHFDFYRRPT